MMIWEPERCNCLIWALTMKRKYGGEIVWRWSYIGWWPHFYWSPDGKTLYEYTPTAYEEPHWIRKVWFKGQVQIMISEMIKKEVLINGVIESITLDMTPVIKSKLTKRG